ncbi:MAG: Tim44 domain-containing protein [Alphaproteobacteria bacterium]|nr:Tim44 domain-containing protein [Alphaproteobacteria bacterium]
MISFVDIIFLTLLVVFIISRLYGIFGTHGSEKNIKVVVKSLDKESEEKLVENITKIIKETSKNNKIAEIDGNNLSDTEKDLIKIPSFDKERFLQGACRVFELVLSAFGSGNIETVKGLMNKKVADALNDVISFRKENKITAEIEFIGFDKTEIKNVKLLKNSVKIVVEFNSEQINILKDVKGNVLEGDENFVQKITDIWTFERSLNAKNNNWVLVSTKKNS